MSAGDPRGDERRELALGHCIFPLCGVSHEEDTIFLGGNEGIGAQSIPQVLLMSLRHHSGFLKWGHARIVGCAVPSGTKHSHDFLPMLGETFQTCHGKLGSGGCVFFLSVLLWKFVIVLLG